MYKYIYIYIYIYMYIYIYIYILATKQHKKRPILLQAFHDISGYCTSSRYFYVFLYFNLKCKQVILI